MPKKQKICSNCESKKTCEVVVYVGDLVACPRKKRVPNKKKGVKENKVKDKKEIEEVVEEEETVKPVDEIKTPESEIVNVQKQAEFSF